MLYGSVVKAPRNYYCACLTVIGGSLRARDTKHCNITARLTCSPSDDLKQKHTQSTDKIFFFKTTTKAKNLFSINTLEH